MGSGKTTWTINNLLNQNLNENILYITPYLDEVKRIKNATDRKMFEPENKGSGKIGNIAKLLTNQMDIVSTHELFRRFDNNCKAALQDNDYTLILDETLTAVEPYHFTGKDDYKYLLQNGDIKVSDDGLIEWVGSELDTRFDDVRILATNRCLFKVDDKFFLWHFPHAIFKLFKKVYVLTYLFEGSLMKYYFDLYNIEYQKKSIKLIDGEYTLVNFYNPDKILYKERINIYNGTLNENISQKDNVLSSTWCKNNYNKKELVQIQKNFYNYCRNIAKTNSKYIMWTSFKDCKPKLSGKGYTNGFVPCNCRATNDHRNATCLMYAVNWYENPEITKFFKQHGITINQNQLALATLLQWIWRSNIRVTDSEKIINIYIPSKRMRNLFLEWLNG